MVFYPRELKAFHDYAMTHYYDDFRSRYLRTVAILCLMASAVCGSGVAFGLTRTELYQATVPLVDRSAGAQASAFQAALKIVLIRVTGRRGAPEDAALAPLLGSTRRYVQQYRGAPDNQLWVAFDGPALERWLTQNGQPVWGRDRPATFVWLSMPTGAQSATFVTADDVSDLKAALVAAASVRGLPLTWPSAADVPKNQVDFAAANGAANSPLVDTARRAGADGVLIGRANGSGANANVRWTLVFQDHNSEWSGTLDGINRTADLYAGLFAASGSLAPVDIEVGGIANLRDYASLQAYLESLTFITHVSVQGLAGDSVTYRLTTRGGVDALQHALALGGPLQTVPGGENGIQRFQLRR